MVGNYARSSNSLLVARGRSKLGRFSLSPREKDCVLRKMKRTKKGGVAVFGQNIFALRGLLNVVLDRIFVVKCRSFFPNAATYISYASISQWIVLHNKFPRSFFFRTSVFWVGTHSLSPLEPPKSLPTYTKLG